MSTSAPSADTLATFESTWKITHPGFSDNLIVVTDQNNKTGVFSTTAGKMVVPFMKNVDEIIPLPISNIRKNHRIWIVKFVGARIGLFDSIQSKQINLNHNGSEFKFVLPYVLIQSSISGIAVIFLHKGKNKSKVIQIAMSTSQHGNHHVFKNTVVVPGNNVLLVHYKVGNETWDGNRTCVIDLNTRNAVVVEHIR